MPASIGQRLLRLLADLLPSEEEEARLDTFTPQQWADLPVYHPPAPEDFGDSSPHAAEGQPVTDAAAAGLFRQTLTGRG